MSEGKPKGQGKTKVTAWFVFAMFVVVMVAIEFLALRGQLDFARYVMELDGKDVYVVPLALEGGTLATAGLAMWATLTKDPTFMHRVWTGVFLGGAAAANWLGAIAAGRSPIAATYLAAFCIAALRMWHAILHRYRRAELRAQGALREPLPHFGVLQWAVAPWETFKAWKRAIRYGFATPQLALAAVRNELDSGDLTPASIGPAAPTADVTQMTKRQAVEHAAKITDSYEVSTVRAWLADQGVTVDESYAHKLLKALAETNRRHVVVAVQKGA